jgi:serine/threonine protein phosphatase PrpC
LAIEESPLDPWTLDTAGRTALHVAAERGHVGCCDALRKAMSAARDDPVGENAPMDMSGRTPCAWAAERVKDAQKRDALEATLFSPGDATVLPRRSETSHAAHAVSSTAGWRVVMEDAHCVCRLDGATLYAVFDGHGGSLVANYAAANIERCLQLSEDPAASLKNALATLDAELAEHPRLAKSRRSGRGGTGPLVAEDESGATALLCLVTRTEVVVAHLGDSRGALLRKQGGTWSSQNLTPADHTAGSPAEAARIDSLQNFGVLRRENDAPRVARKVDGAVVENGALQTTRALGDFVFKTATERAVTCEADARVLSLQECRGGERSCVLLACDGLWDVLTGEECGAILDSCVEGLDAQCDALVAECVRRRSRDNVTAILVDLDASAAAKALAFGGGTP